MMPAQRTENAIRTNVDRRGVLKEGAFVADLNTLDELARTVAAPVAACIPTSRQRLALGVLSKLGAPAHEKRALRALAEALAASPAWTPSSTEVSVLQRLALVGGGKRARRLAKLAEVVSVLRARGDL